MSTHPHYGKVSDKEAELIATKMLEVVRMILDIPTVTCPTCSGVGTVLRPNDDASKRIAIQSVT